MSSETHRLGKLQNLHHWRFTATLMSLSKPFPTGESALGQGHQPGDFSQSLEALFLMTCIDLQNDTP